MGIFRSEPARTGIDIGSGAIKVVRTAGVRGRVILTHAGRARWQPVDTVDPPDPRGQGALAAASEALRRLLRRLGLSRRALGKIAVAVRADDASIHEAVLPALTPDELKRAVPYEAARHLALEQMDAPIIGHHVLGDAPPPVAAGPPMLRVLLAAVPRGQRDFPLSVLARAGLDPMVVDLEPLAGLNALFSLTNGNGGNSRARSLLDLGHSHAALHIASAAGGFLTRSYAMRLPESHDGAAIADYVAQLKPQIVDTLAFYRSRFRNDVGAVWLCGGGAVLPGIVELLAAEGTPAFIPLNPFTAKHRANRLAGLEEHGPCFATAWGLAQWWESE